MNRPAQIAVASGKGGTGKTTVSALLARAWGERGEVTLLDLDVEAPDLLGYFPDARPVREPLPVELEVPLPSEEPCDGCNRCAEICPFGALTVVRGVVRINTGVCKGCGRCLHGCPEAQLQTQKVKIGEVKVDRTDRFRIVTGEMKVGDIRATGVIGAVLRTFGSGREEASEVVIRDCPPGTTCPTVRAIHRADLVLLVAEPTPFSLHDLRGALRMVREMELPAALVINKSGEGEVDLAAFAERENLPVVGVIPWSLEAARAGARGELPENDRSIEEMAARVMQEVRRG